MVQGHTIDAVLAPQYRAGAVHAGWLWLRGLTSVAFLFAAGAAFHLATLRDFDRQRTDRAGVSRRLQAPGRFAAALRFRRAMTLVLLGYALHVPLSLPFVRDSAVGALLVRQAFAVDVLQCIGVCLALLEALALLLPSARAVELACALLAALALGLSPLTASLDPGAWFPLLAYVTPRAGSLFPLLPWAGHVLLGAASARVLFLAPRRGLRLALAGCVLVAATRAWPMTAAPAPDHLSRLGFVLLSLALLSTIERKAAALPAWAWVLSGETLFIYVFHVLLVYGQGVGLGALVGPALGPAAAARLALGMIALSFAGALVYRWFMAGLARSTATG
jgi:hypothetical protein